MLSNIDEIKQHVAVDGNMEFLSLLPDFGFAARILMNEGLGSVLYLLLNTAYKDGIDSADERLKNLLPYVQAPMAKLLIGKWVTQGQVKISDRGVQIQVDSVNKTAFAWQVQDLKRELFSDGYNALEILLEYLESNESVYPEWEGSPAYTIYRELLIRKASEFSDYYHINGSRRLFSLMRPAMRKVELFSISPVITKGVFHTLKQMVTEDAFDTGDVIADAYYQLWQLLKPAIANLTIARALTELPIDIKDNTVVINELAATEGKTESRPDADLLAAKRDAAYTDGMQYLGLAVEYLKENASETLFESFYEQVHLQSTATSQKGKSIYGAF